MIKSQRKKTFNDLKRNNKLQNLIDYKILQADVRKVVIKGKEGILKEIL